MESGLNSWYLWLLFVYFRSASNCGEAKGSAGTCWVNCNVLLPRYGWSTTTRWVKRVNNGLWMEKIIIDFAFFCSSVHWRKNGKKLTSVHSRIQIQNFAGVSMLRIDPIRHQRDDATYECLAENGVGDPVTASANLTVFAGMWCDSETAALYSVFLARRAFWFWLVTIESERMRASTGGFEEDNGSPLLFGREWWKSEWVIANSVMTETKRWRPVLDAWMKEKTEKDRILEAHDWRFSWIPPRLNTIEILGWWESIDP